MTLSFVIPELNIGGTGTPPLQFFKQGFAIGGLGGSQPTWQDVILKGNTSLTLVNAKANSLEYLKLFGKCEQNGTPTPTVPVDIVCNNGAIKYSLNMANVNAQTALVGYYISSSGVVLQDVANWMYQDYIPVEPSTTYTLTISTPVYYVTISEYKTADDGGFSRRNAGSTGGNTTLTITTRSTTKYLRFGANIDSSNVTLNKVLAINWMLNKGNSMPYAPYSEDGIYTDGTVETVQVHSVNVFDKTKEDALIVGFPAANGKYNETVSFRSVCCKLSENKTYTITRVTSNPTSAAMRVIAYDKVPTANYYGTTLHVGANTEKTATITVPIGKPYIVTYVKHSTDSITDQSLLDGFQIELGSTATTYEPYWVGGTATAEMLLKLFNKGGDSIYAQDTQNVTTGEVTRNVGIKVLDGTEAWVRSDQSGFMYVDNLIQFSINAPLCSHYLGTTSASASGSNKIRLAMSGSNYRTIIYASLSDYQTAESFKQFLADQYANGTPVTVVYPLATAKTETVTAQPLTIQAGTNVVEITQASIDNLELEVSYKAGVEVTVTEIENAQLDNSVEVTVNG